MNKPEHRTATIPSGDVEIFYRAFGRPGAVPVLIVHGLSYFSYDWIDVADALATDREVVAMDMRGFGESGWSAERNYAVSDFSADIINLMDHLDWRRGVLMGHSMGGRNATWCAADNPDRIAALVLVDYSPENAPDGSKRVATTVANVPDRFETVEAAIRYFGKDPDDPAVQARFEAYLDKRDDGYVIKRDTWHRERFRKVLAGEGRGGGPDMWAALARVRCPTLVLRGTGSDMFAPETAERVRAANTCLTVVEVDAGHDIAGDAPDALIEHVGNFLTKGG